MDTVPWEIHRGNSWCPLRPTFLFANYYALYCASYAFVLAVGIFLAFCGYRIYRLSIFVVGWMFGASVLYLVCQSEEAFEHVINLSVAGSGGFATALILCLLTNTGLCFLACLAGVSLCIPIVCSVAAFLSLHALPASLAALFFAAILFGTLSVFARRFFAIISTAILGGFLITLAVDYFLQFSLMTYASIILLWKGQLIQVCWFTTFVLILWPVFAIIGIIIQSCFTARYFDHEDTNDEEEDSCGGTMPTLETLRSNSRISEGSSRALTLRQNSNHSHTKKRTPGDVVSQEYIKTHHNALPVTLKSFKLRSGPAEPHYTALSSTLYGASSLYGQYGQSMNYNMYGTVRGHGRGSTPSTLPPGYLRPRNANMRGSSTDYEELPDYCSIDYGALEANTMTTNDSNTYASNSTRRYQALQQTDVLMENPGTPSPIPANNHNRQSQGTDGYLTPVANSSL